jgi:hypothetical protein
MFLFKKKESKVENKREEEMSKFSFINKSSELNECIICLEKMKENEKLMILKCTHIYHHECLSSWLSKKSICPLCDTNI